METSGPFQDAYLYQTWTSTKSLVCNRVCLTLKSISWSTSVSLCLEACTVVNANIWQPGMETVGGIIRSLCCSSVKIHMQGGRILEGQTGTIVNILLLKNEDCIFQMETAGGYIRVVQWQQHFLGAFSIGLHKSLSSLQEYHDYNCVPELARTYRESFFESLEVSSHDNYNEPLGGPG